MEEKKHAETHLMRKKRFSVWKFASVILFILLLASVFTYGFRGRNTQAGVVSKEQAAQKTLDFINNELLAGRDTATLNSVTEENSMYKVSILVAGQEGSVYVSRDGKFLFPQAVDMDLEIPDIPLEVPQETLDDTTLDSGTLDNTSQETL